MDIPHVMSGYVKRNDVLFRIRSERVDVGRFALVEVSHIKPGTSLTNRALKTTFF